MNFLKKISALILFTALSTLFFHSVAHAAYAVDQDLRPDYAPQGYMEVYENNENNPSANFSDRSITYIVADVAVVLLQISGILAVFFIILSGFNYIKAFGQEEEIQKAKKGMTWAIIGLIVVILSYAIVQNVIRITLTVDPAAVEETAAAADEGDETAL